MTVYVDGGCTNNHKKDAKRRMRIVVSDDSGRVLADKTREGGSNNIAELWAIAEAMILTKTLGITDLTVFTDSKNNLAWLKGRIGENLNNRISVINLLTP